MEVSFSRRCISAREKLETPMAFAFPDLTVFSIALYVWNYWLELVETGSAEVPYIDIVNVCS